MHDLPLIATIAAAFTAAWLLGLLTQWLGLSPIVGYLLAGVLIGKHTPGFVGDLHLAHQLAEVGVILLMFGVGLHFHLKDLIAVKGIAVPGAVVQSLAATVLAMLVFSLFGMPMKTGAVIGMAMAVASTVVLMRVLMDADVLNSPQGHVAVGWLIVEDIFTVVLLVLIPALGVHAGGSSQSIPVWQALGIALLKLGVLVVIVMVAGSRIVPWVLVRVARLRSRELFTLTVLVFSIAIAAGSYYFFGASMALGAFLAGMVVAQSPVSHQAAADALPMRDAFAVMFFVSVGMIFDPAFLLQQPLMVAAALGIILLGKPLAALVIIGLLGYSVRTSLTVAIGLAQIGEFSFILSDVARKHGLMPDAGHNVLVAAAIISITLNPMLFRALPKWESWLRARPRLWKMLNARAERKAAAFNKSTAAGVSAAPGDRSKGLAIVVGYGPVGRSVHSALLDAGLEAVVIDLNMDTVSALNASGNRAIFGDASNSSILEQAGVAQASHLVLTLPSSSDSAAVVTAARSLNQSMRILVRARYLSEREELERGGASSAVFEEEEAAVALARLALADTGLHREAAERKIKDLRLQLITENMSSIRTQRIASVMVPWARVRWLPTTLDKDGVLHQVAQERFSRWPVVEPKEGKAAGYLLTKDLISLTGDDWLGVMRPLKTVAPGESIDATLLRMQSEAASVYLVEEAGKPLGLITLEDILEQVVGKLEDEYPHEKAVSLAEADLNGAIVLRLEAPSREQAIQQLVQAVPRRKLPPETDLEKLAELALKREEEFSTDLGNGIAIPHSRCPGLSAPLAVIGRTSQGIMFSTESAEPVRLLFLLITPAERPETQLELLSQVARIAASQARRTALLEAESPADILAELGKPA